MVGADHVVVRDRSGGKREGDRTSSLYYLASPTPNPATKPGADPASGDGTQNDHDVARYLPEVRTKPCDVSTHDTITDDGSGAAEDADDDDGADVEDEDDELVYSKSSGLSTAFSMETIVNPSTAHSRSSFGETDTSSRNATNTSSDGGGSTDSGGDAGSESTVVMYNNASRCRRSPQEIIWMDEAWLYECESVYGFRSSDRLALLHDVASGDDLDACLYDADDDAMSDSCGRLLLMRSVALCKGKLKPSPGFVASSPKRSGSGASSSAHKSTAAGLLTGKLFEYTKL
jgi:hypothetical protein